MLLPISVNTHCWHDKSRHDAKVVPLFPLETLMVLTENQSVAWYTCEATLGKERYVRLNGWKTRRKHVDYVSLMVSCYWIKVFITVNR